VSEVFDEDEVHEPGPPRSRSRLIVIAATVVVAGFFALTAFASLYTDRLWYQSVDFGSVFSRLLWTKVGLFLFFGLLMFGVTAASIYLAFRYRPLIMPAADRSGLDRYRSTIAPVSTWVLVSVSAMLGLFAGSSATGQWRNFMLWRNGVPFGQKDVYYGKDIGFYVFDLPWLHYAVDSVMAMTFIGLLVSATTHYLYGGIRLQDPHDKLSGAAQVQLSALLGVFVLAKAGDYWLDRYDLVTDSGRLITGMTYTDDHAVLPAKSILMFIAVICAVLFFLNMWRRTWLLPSVGLVLLVISSILLGVIWPGFVQQVQVNPTEADKEQPYIAAHIKATRAAYNLQDVEVTDYINQVTKPQGKLSELDAETSSIPLVDPQLVHATFEQNQQVRAYYSVAPVLDVDHYLINGINRALVLGVRELDQNGIAEQDRNWSNLHTVYTHGNGMIAAFANQRPADNSSEKTEIQWAEGQQAGEDTLSELGANGYESRVYFGEQSPDYSIVGKTSGQPNIELDLGNEADNDQDQRTTYSGAGGVAVGSLFHQLLYAVKFGEPNFVLSGRVNDNSKVLYYRQPRERVEKVAPWLTVDSDPYPAVIDGRIVWLLDGYTTPDRYPLSQRSSLKAMTDDSLNRDNEFGTLPTDEINYMRNAVKATVDAYDGTVHLYAWDTSDPMLQAWRKAFPGTVEDKSDIPPDVLAHMRYPEDQFKVQRYQFARYHVTDASDFFLGSNRWAVPADPYAPTTYQPPYRLFISNDGTPTYSLTSVYVPSGKENLAAFVSVNADATSPDYGRIQVLQLPNEQTQGPSQVATDMSTSDNVRRELTAFNVGETKPIFGNLLTLPVDKGLMYVQPVYASRSSTTSYPILQFVIVSYGGEVGIGKTIGAALADVLGVAPGTVTSPPDTGNGGKGDHGKPGGTGTVEEQIASLLSRADAAFARADKAQRGGDSVEWAKQIEKARTLVTEAARLSARAEAAAAAVPRSSKG
jgi:uncharacterized membrane protein (UPF0182 family)